MDRRVTIGQDQHFRPEDVDNLARFPMDGDESLTRSWLGDLRYSGFVTAADGQNAVVTGPGFVYIGFREFSLRENRTVSLLEEKPLLAGGRRYVILAAQGIPDRPAPSVSRDVTREVPDGNGGVVLQDVTESVAPFFINAAEVTKLAGNLSTQPQLPSIPANVVPFASVILDINGIVPNSLQMLARYRTPTMTGHELLLQQQAALIGIMASEVQALRNEIVALETRLRSTVSASTLDAVLEDVAYLKDQADVDDRGAPYGYDRLLDEGETNAGHVDYNARVDEGIRFPYANVNRTPLAVFNANDPRLMHMNKNLIFPAYDPVIGFEVHSEGQSAPLGGTVTQSMVLRKLSRTRTRIRYGDYFYKSVNSSWWRQGDYDPATGIFTRNGESFQLSGNPQWENWSLRWWHPNHWWWHRYFFRSVRMRRVFVDTWEEPYEAWEHEDTTIQGVIKAQTFQQSQERYVPSIRLGILNWEAGAEVTAALCELFEDGAPNPGRVIQTVTLEASGFNAYQNGDAATMTRFGFPEPAFLKRAAYGVIFSTTGQVTVAVASGEQFLGGNYFESTDGTFFVGSILKDLAFGVDYCHFRATALDVRLQNMNLAGGIMDADIIAGTTIPTNTAVQFQPFTGGIWRTIVQVPAIEDGGIPDDTETGFGNGTQSTYDFRVFLTGNEWVMPVLDLNQSEMTLFRPGVAFHHVSVPREVPAGTYAKVTFKAQLAGWDSARHTIEALLKHDATLTTTEAPDGSPKINYIASVDRYEAVWEFSVDPANNVLEFHIEGTTDNAAIPFVVEHTFYKVG